MVLTEPVEVSVGQHLDDTISLFQDIGIAVRVADRQSLELPELEDLDIGACENTELTPDQIALFGHRGGAAATDVVAYFVDSTRQLKKGCAAHPAGFLGFVITSDAARWTFAHEIGHVFGLEHVPDRTRLMYEFPEDISGRPVITDEERDIILRQLPPDE